MNRFFTCTLVALAATLVFARPVTAQDVTPAPPVVAETTTSLAEWLISLQNPRKGVLLQVMPAESANRRSAPHKPKPGESPMTLAGYLEGTGAVLRRSEAFTLITKSTMPVYNPRPVPVTPADAALFGGDYDEETSLLASLDKAQCRIMASPEGLGFAGLSPEQQALWERLVPNPFAYKRQASEGKPATRALTDDERHSIRLRVKFVSTVYVKSAGSGQSDLLKVDKRSVFAPHDFVFVVDEKGNLLHRAKPSEKARLHHLFDQSGQWEWGQLIVAEKPVRPKPSDLRYENLTAPVSLLPAGKDGITVGELTTRVRGATEIAIYAHRRVAGEVVVLACATGGAALQPAGELLSTIATSIHGTVRRLPPGDGDVAPLYVLTRDREPTLPQNTRAEAWFRAGRRLTGGSRERLWERVRAENIVSLLAFDTDDAVRTSPNLMKRYAEAMQSSPLTAGRYGVEVKRSELPPAEQSFLSAENAEWNKYKRGQAEKGNSDLQKNGNTSIDTVWVGADIRWCYELLQAILPGASLRDSYLGNYPEWLPREPVVVPETPLDCRGRAVILAARTSADGEKAVAVAESSRASALWLDAPPAILRAALRIAPRTLPIFAVVRPLSAEGAPGALLRDRNIYNQPTPTLEPDDPRTMQWARERTRQFAALPHLAGIVLADVLPPGYRGAHKEDVDTGTWTGDIGSRDYETLDKSQQLWGYTPRHRRTFLRQHGADPLDVLLTEYGIVGEGRDEARFGYDESLADDWNRFRRDRCADLLAALRTETGTLPVYLEGEGVFQSIALWQRKEPTGSDTVRFYVPWKAPDKPPIADLYRGAWREALPVPDAKTGALIAVQSGQTATPASRNCQAVEAHRHAPINHDGLVAPSNRRHRSRTRWASQARYAVN